MKILLVSDDDNKKKQILSKLIFLRACDKVFCTDFDSVFRDLKAYNPDIVLICEEKTKAETVEYIKNISTDNICTILIAKSYNADFILACTDSGASDFIMEDGEDFEFVVRIVKHIEHHSTKSNLYANLKLLEDVNIVDSDSGFYTSGYAKQVIGNFLDIDLNTEGTFMVLSPDKAERAKSSDDSMTDAIKSSVRCDDIVCLGKGTNYYIFLKDTDMNGAILVFNKIKENLEFKIHAGIAETRGKTFEEFEKCALNALSTSSATDVEFSLYNDDNENGLSSWLDDAPKKGYKIYRQIFNKKLENVIAPLFYRLQQSYEPKLINTQIIQQVKGDNCYFVLKGEKFESELKVIYPGFSKIIISINHEGLDTPENRELHLQLSKVTEKEIAEIVENFIKEYKAS